MVRLEPRFVDPETGVFRDCITTTIAIIIRVLKIVLTKLINC